MSLSTFEFRSHKNDGLTISVEAQSEAEARTIAMERLWGPPTGPFLNVGSGLDLVRKRKAHAEVSS